MNEKKPFFNLQICRGIAAVIVVLAHTNFIDKNLFSGFLIIGYNGVDFFFVLSGFIIYYVNHTYISDSSKYGKYLFKRLVRIFPIYWVYTIPVIALHFLKLKVIGNPLVSWIDLDAAGITKSFLLYPTHVANNEMPIIPVAWTLSFELLFYLLFGLGILTKKRILVLIGAVWLIGITLASLLTIDIPDNPLLMIIFSSKNFEFIYGCIIAEMVLRSKTIKQRNTAVTTLAIGILLLSFSWINEALVLKILPKMDSLTFGIPYALIIYALVSMETSQIKSKSKKFFVYLGDASYSIYLTHYIGIELLKNPLHKIVKNGYVEFFLIIITLTFFGCLCYNYIEKPLLNLFNNRSRKNESKPAQVY